MINEDYGSKARASIDQIDREIMDLIQERFDLVTAFHIWKTTNGLPLRDERREAEVIENYRQGLDEDGPPIARAIIG